MWNFWHKEERLKEALRYRGVDPEAMSVGKLMACLSRRSTDKVLNPLIYELLSILEPQACWMEHCEHYGGQCSFCHCRLKKVPGRCGIYRAFKKRKAARAAKKAAAI